MTTELERKMTELLLTEFGDQLSSAEGQRTLVLYSGLSQDLQNSISIGGPASQFVTSLVAFLQSVPPQADGQFPLGSFLVGITDLVRAERRSDWQAQCAEICRALESNPVAPPRQEPSQRKEYSGEFRRKIIQYLSAIPHLADAHTQQTLIEYATLDRELQAFLAVGQPPLPFTTLLVSTLLNYGPLSDGRNPLEALLEASKTLIQEQQQAECDTLIRELHAVSQTTEPPVQSHPEPVRQQETVDEGAGTEETPPERSSQRRPLGLYERIVDILCAIPQINNVQVQEALIEKAPLDQQLRWQLQIGMPPAHFAALLVSKLRAYGALQDGRDALEALLVTARSFLREEHQADCDLLIQELRTSASTKEAHSQQPSKDVRRKKSADVCATCGQPLSLIDKLFLRTKCKRCR